MHRLVVEKDTASVFAVGAKAFPIAADDDHRSISVEFALLQGADQLSDRRVGRSDGRIVGSTRPARIADMHPEEKRALSLSLSVVVQPGNSARDHVRSTGLGGRSPSFSR